MSIPTLFWGDSIQPGSKPVWVFPVTANSLHLDLQINLKMYADPDSVVPGLTSTIVFTPLNNTIELPTVFGEGFSGTMTGEVSDTEQGYAIGETFDDPEPKEFLVSGQLANLEVFVSINGAAPVAGLGVLAEIGGGLYSYTLDSTETAKPGPVVVVIKAINPDALAPEYTTPVVMNGIVAKPGIPITRITESSLTEAMGPTVQQLENYIQEAMGTILNAMQTKPTFRRNT